MSRTTKLYFRFLQQMLVLLVVLFALAPCSIKNSILYSFDIQYNTPLNKSQTSSSIQNSCTSSLFSKTNKEVQLNQLLVQIPYTKLQPLYFVSEIKISVSNDLKIVANNKPALYLLYKQLKLDIL